MDIVELIYRTIIFSKKKVLATTLLSGTDGRYHVAMTPDLRYSNNMLKRHGWPTRRRVCKKYTKLDPFSEKRWQRMLKGE